MGVIFVRKGRRGLRTWFPEPARILALKGAELLVYPSAIGSELDSVDTAALRHWHGDASAKAAGIELRYGALANSLAAARRGLRHSAGWPLAFAWAVLRGATRRGLRQLKGA